MSENKTSSANQVFPAQDTGNEDKYRTLFQDSPLPIFVYSQLDYKFLDVNAGAIYHYGYSKEEFLSMDVLSIRPKEDVQKFIEQSQTVATGYREAGVWRHIKKDGTIVHVNIFSHAIEYNHIPAKLVLIEDITERLKAEKALREMEKEVLDQKVEQQKQISKAIIKAQETERNRIGQELHDNVNQILAGTKLYLNMAVKENEGLRKLVQYPIELIDSTISEIRLLSKKHVTPLRDINLEQLINSLVHDSRSVSDLSISFKYMVDEHDLDDDLKLNIYRIIQEQMNNITRHAKASKVSIHLNETGNDILINVSDNGKGFDTNLKRNGIGISNMINRVETFNGKIKIESAPGHGCEVKVSMPFRK